MQKDILVSIIIPLYNKEQYFERCFNSVVCQAYTNIECIIVEDCSTDSSLKLAEGLIKNYTGSIRFVLIKQKENSGVSEARNTGINNSNGEYIFFLDADDEITGICINSLVTLAQKYSGVDMVQGNILRYPQRSSYLDTEGKLPEYVQGNLKIEKHYPIHIPDTVWNKLIRKGFIKQNLYFKSNIRHEDAIWCFFCFKKIETFAFTEEYTYIYHVLPDNFTNDTSHFLSISGRLTTVEEMLHNLDIDFLYKQIKEVRRLLNWQKERILSDERYSSLMPKCQMLLNKLPRWHFLFGLAFLELLRTSKTTIRRVLGKKMTEKIKSFIKKDE